MAALGPNDWWVEARGSVFERNADSGIGTAELQHEVTGFLIGVDHSNDGWVMGVAFGQSQGETDLDDRLSNADTETWSLGIYGSGTLGTLTAGSDGGESGLAAQIKYGAFGNWHSVDTTRTVTFEDFYENLQASSIQAFIEIGSRIELEVGEMFAGTGGGAVDEGFIQPFASVVHVSLETDDYIETAVGGGTGEAALTADESRQNVITTTLGIRSGVKIDNIKLQSMIGWWHGFGDVELESESSG